MEQTSELTTAQAIQILVRGVNREGKRGNLQAHDLVRDAILLKDQNVRKLATVAEANDQDLPEDERKLRVGFDSYLSYMSNAKSVAAMFDFNLEAFEAFLAETKLVGLSAIFKAFRELFGPPAKPAKPREGDADKNEVSPEVPLIDQMLTNLQHLSVVELTVLYEVVGQLLMSSEQVAA